MKRNYKTIIRKGFYLCAWALLQANIGLGQNTVTSFTASDLKGVTIGNPTSLDFGPDGNLYVAQQDGLVKVFAVTRNGANNYSAT